MADVKISEMTQDGTVSGVEKIPVSDAGSPKHVTITQVKDFVVDQIEAIAAGTTVSGADSVFIMQGGVLKPVDIDKVAQHAIDTVWGKAAETAGDDADILPLKDGGVTEKTITLANLKTYISTALQTAMTDISTLSAAGAVSASDLYLIAQGGVGKKITHTDLTAAIMAGLEDYVSAKTSASSVSAADLTYLIQSGVDKKVTIELIAAAVLAAFDTYTTALAAVSSSQTTDVFYVLQGGVEKKATLTQITAAILAAMDSYVTALSAGSTPVAADEFYTLQSSVEKKVTTSQLSTAILGDFVAHVTACGAATSLSDADTLYVVQSATGKKVAFSVIVSSIFDGYIAYVNALSAATLAGTDVFHVIQGSAEKKTTLTAISTSVLSGLVAHVTALSAVSSTTDADVFYTLQGGTAKKVTLAQIVAHAGGLINGSGTALTLAKWSDSNTLTDGPTMTESSAGFTAGTDLALPTTAAVRGEMDTIVYDATDIGEALVDADELLVYNVSGAAQRKSAMSRIWTYVTTAIQALSAKTTPVDADILTIQDSAASSALKELTVGNLWDNRYLADAQAIKIDDFTAGDDNTDLNATTSKHGLLPKLGSGTTNYLRADGTWAEPPGTVGWDGDITDANIDGAADIGEALADADLIIVDNGAVGTNVKSALSRMWTYIWSKVTGATPKTTPVDADGIGIVDSEASSVVKLLTFANMWTNYLAGKVTTAITGTKIDDLTAGDDNTDLDASVAKHGLLPKLGGGTDNFLRADGGWSVPPGTGGWDGDLMDIDIDGGIDIGFDLTDADLMIIDEGAVGVNRKSTLSRMWTYIASKLTSYKIDNLATADDNTDLNANTTNHGLLLKATAPAASTLNVVGIANGETAYTNKTLFDATNPEALGSVGPGTSVSAAHRDHVHANPAIDTLAAATDITTLDASTSAHGLVVKATAPASGLINVVAIGNGETAYTNKALLDSTNPAALGSVAPGTAVVAARRDHVHANPALDTLAVPTDITTLDATTLVHGLMPKLDKVKLDGIEAAADVTDAGNVATAGAIMDGDFTINGMMMRTGAGTYASILHKFDATSAPTVNDDVDLNYSIGSLWINTTTDKVYSCVDTTNGAAVWLDLTEAAAGWDGNIDDMDINGTGTEISAALEDADLFVLYDNAPGAMRKSLISRVWTYISGKLSSYKLDDLATADDNTDLNANTTNHGLLLKATAPAAGIVNFVGIANAETAYTNKALVDDTNPAALGSVAPGTATVAARRDHVHANPALDTLAATTDITTLDATTSAHGLVVKAVAPAVSTLNVVGIANGETAYTNKTLFDATNPANLGAVAPGTSVVAAHRDHVHANPAIDTLAAATDITTLDASTSAHGLVVKATAPLAGIVNVVGIANGETAYTNKALFDSTNPAALGTAAPGTAVIAARRDHVHAEWDGDIADINLDGGADINADLADADLVLVDDGAGGTNRKSAISRIWTYIWSKVTGATAKTIPVDGDGIGIVDSEASSVVKLLTFANAWTNYLAGKVTTAITGTKIDDLTAGDDNTDLNASTTKHGLLLKATAPAAGIVNFVGIANAETVYTNKALLDDTNPVALGAVGPGTATVAARRDHVHANPAIDTLAAATDITTLDASTSAHGLVVKATAPAAGIVNVVGIANGETAYTNKALFDSTNPAALGVAAPGTATIAARRDHVHAEWDGDIADINLDGGTDIGAALADADLILVDDGAGGTNRKCAMSRVKTYIDTIGTYDEIYIDAGAMVGCTTAGASTGTYEYGTNDIEFDYFAFDGGATEERIQFKAVMPSSWDLSTVKVKFFWTSATGSTAGDTVEWGIKAGALSNDDAIDAALGSAVTVSDTLLANNGGDIQVTAATGALTVGGTPALGDLIAFEVYRNTDGADDMTEDAWLLGVQIQYKKTNTVAAW